jgi:uncharacterized protein with HEPN domain
MPFSPTVAALNDILHHIDLATQFAEGLDRAVFVDDKRTFYATIRCLEIISEASRRLPDDLKARHPTIEWKKIAGAGNVYRHDYEEVAAEYIWDTVQLALPPLRAVVMRELGGRNS